MSKNTGRREPFIPYGGSRPLAQKLDATDSESQYPSNPPDATNTTSLADWKKVESFLSMSTPYFRESTEGKWLFAAMIALCFLNSGVSVAFSYISRDFWSALSSKDSAQFYTILAKFSGALVVGAPVSVLYRWQRDRVAIAWREWMTTRTLDLYYSNRVYYALERGREVDNPDQRIAEDVKSFTSFSLSLFLTVVTSSIDLVSFSLILYSIQPSLFIAIFAYAFFGTFITAALGQPLIPLNYLQLQKEANFRYALVRFRDNAESVAFYRGENLEAARINSRLGKAIDNKKNIIDVQRNLEFFTTSYGYLIQVLPVAVVAPRYFAGEIQLGVISQSVGAFNHILSDLSVIVNQFEQLSAFSAGIDRLSEFLNAMKEADPERSPDTPIMKQFDANATLPSSPHDAIQLIPNPSHSVLSLQNLTVLTPDRKRRLVSSLSLSLPPRKNLLVVGNSGCGKSSLLRAVAGLWNAGSGNIARPEDTNFLPQQPYCVLGTLRDQVLYPTVNATYSDEVLREVLARVDLEDLPDRFKEGLEAEKDWSTLLSLGEQQRISFARILLRRPELVILDEATSAMDVQTERRMYELLGNIGTTYVSVGHRPSLVNYHDVKLRIGEEHQRASVEEIGGVEKQMISNL